MSNSEVYIGGKDLASYLEAVKHQLSENGECVVVARGKDNNARAIDTVVISRRDTGAEVTDFSLSTHGFYENEEGEQVEIEDKPIEDYEEDYEVTKVSGLRIKLEE